MYAYITGQLKQKDPAQAIIEAGGVGYLLRISVYTFEQIKLIEGNCRLFAWLHVKEDAHTLYGFAQADEKALFLHLISVSGIGPGTALMMISHTAPVDLLQAIINGDVRAVQNIKGIGPKTAQRLILELKDKLQKTHWQAEAGLSEGGVLSDTNADGSKALTNATKAEARSNRETALAALLTLGIGRATAEKNLDTVIKRDGHMLTTEELVKRSLRS
jgi:Holliday junction DNA helicase RuvA